MNITTERAYCTTIQELRDTIESVNTNLQNIIRDIDRKGYAGDHGASLVSNSEHLAYALATLGKDC
jgi:hypothetical protein